MFWAKVPKDWNQWESEADKTQQLTTWDKSWMIMITMITPVDISKTKREDVVTEEAPAMMGSLVLKKYLRF